VPWLSQMWSAPVRYQHRIGEIDVPKLHISGWYDDEEIGTPANFVCGPALVQRRAGQQPVWRRPPGSGRGDGRRTTGRVNP